MPKSRVVPLEIDPIMEVMTEHLNRSAAPYDIVALRHWVIQRIYVAQNRHNRKGIAEGSIIHSWLYEFQDAYGLLPKNREE